MAIVGVAVLVAAAFIACASCRAAEPDSVGVWLPESVDEIDAPEQLDEPDSDREPERPDHDRARAQVGWDARGRATTHAAWEGRGVAAAVVTGPAGRDGSLAFESRRFFVGAGALATPGWGLFGERVGLTRPDRTIGPGQHPHDPARAVAGAGADVGGAALAFWPRAGAPTAGEAASEDALRPRASTRLLAGHRRRGKGDVAVGELRLGWSASAFVLREAVVRDGAREESPREKRLASILGLRFESRRGPSQWAAEAIADPKGVSAEVDASIRDGPRRVAATWRRRAGAPRADAVDLEASWLERAGGARLRWRSWSARATSYGDDGRVELDLSLGRAAPGASTLRLAAKPRTSRGTGGERLAIGEMIVARERGRELRLATSTRAVQDGAAWRLGRMLGASLRLGSERRALLELRAEAVRVDRNGAAWGRALHVASGGSLAARTRPGVRVAARASVRVKGWRLGAAVDDETESTSSAGAHGPRADLWMTWYGGTGAH